MEMRRFKMEPPRGCEETSHLECLRTMRMSGAGSLETGPTSLDVTGSSSTTSPCDKRRHLILLSLVKPALFVINLSLIGLLDSLVDTVLRCGFESQIWRRLNVYLHCLFHPGSTMCNPSLNAYQHKNNFNKIYSTVKLNKNPLFVRLCNKKAQHSILVFLYARIYQCNEKIWIQATLLEP